jgi:hypothetical protein
MRLSHQIAFLTRFALAAALAMLASQAAAQSEETAAEQQVKVAYLYKFGSYIEWPAEAFGSAEAAIVIGVLGADDLADDLARTVARRTVSGRPVAVKKLRRGGPYTGLHIVFVSRSESARLAEVVAAVRGQPVLVVSESDEGLEKGSMINFVLVEDKLRFDVSVGLAERGNIRISSRLLAVARKVVSRPS